MTQYNFRIDPQLVAPVNDPELLTRLAVVTSPARDVSDRPTRTEKSRLHTLEEKKAH